MQKGDRYRLKHYFWSSFKLFAGLHYKSRTENGKFSQNRDGSASLPYTYRADSYQLIGSGRFAVPQFGKTASALYFFSSSRLTRDLHSLIMRSLMNHGDPYEDEYILLNNFNAGNNAAFKKIYDTHYRPMFHFANRYVKDTDQADDILAESFIVVWQKRAEFETYKGLVAYLYTIIRNACLSHIRKVKTRTNSASELAYLHQISEQRQGEEGMKADLLQLSLIEGSKLPSEMKKVFQLIYMEGFSLGETAGKLRISVNTVRTQRANAVRRIRENLIRKGLLGWIF